MQMLCHFVWETWVPTSTHFGMEDILEPIHPHRYPGTTTHKDSETRIAGAPKVS